MRKATQTLAASIGVLLVVWVAAVSGARLAALLRGRTPRDGIGETRFYDFFYRDPPLVGRLGDIARPLPTGLAVVPVCDPECETGWYTVMAAYALPRQAAVAAKTVGQLGAVFPTRIVRTRTEVRVEPRSGSDARR